MRAASSSGGKPTALPLTAVQRFLVVLLLQTLLPAPAVPSPPAPRHPGKWTNSSEWGGTARIGFDLPLATRVRLEVFDLQGRRVRRLLDARLEAGWHQVQWDRRGADGALVPAGLYLYRITAGAFHDEKAMIVFR